MATARKHLLSQHSGIGIYHCISRVVDRNFVFGDREREVFRKTMRQVEAFSGVRVLTWTILSNHFHLLLDVPPASDLNDTEILRRCRALYSAEAMADVEWEYEEAVRRGPRHREQWRSKYLRRMWDLSEFMKTLKQKFTMWFNRLHGREGTLWERRFQSVLVEGNWGTILKVAAYIDLNAVRAGMVEDPKDYRWCGYAQAVAGDRVARQRLVEAMGTEQPNCDWRHVRSAYRRLIFGISDGGAPGKNLSRGEISRTWSKGGNLSLPQLLRCRIRYFSDGLAIGGEAFLGRFFSARRKLFGKGRETGARLMRRGEWGELRTLRALTKEPIVPPPRGSPG